MLFFGSHYGKNISTPWLLNDLNNTVLILRQTPSSELKEKLSTFDFSNMSQANIRKCWLAMAYSHLDLTDVELLDLVTILTLDLQVQFDVAISLGRLSLFEQLIELAADQLVATIAANNFNAFRQAAKNGHVDIMNYILGLLPDQVSAMIAVNDFEAFRLAAKNGHLDVLARILELTRDKAAMIAASHFYAFRVAVEYGRESVVQHLLLYPTVLAFAEIHEHEYRECVQIFIRSTITNIRHECLEFEQTYPDAVFDIYNENTAQSCFYMIRHFIRCNQAELLESIRFLLAIPAVKALIHKPVTPGEENELLRLGLIIGNQEAAALLLTIPAVCELASRNDFYQHELQGQLDLRALAQNNESSMRGLSPAEHTRLQAVIEQYKPRMTGGIAEVMNELQQTLTTRYTASPATIIKDNGQLLILPQQWIDFIDESLNSTERQRALTSYYQHREHTAFRYLSKPNPWMATNASYVNVNPYNPDERWSTFDEYQELVSLMYLAAIDASCAPVDGYTLETRLEQFIHELAHIGRAHNWDMYRERVNQDGDTVLEEYDDLEGDKPSCYSGVKRRLFQSVQGHPLFTFLTMEGIKQELRGFMRAHFKEHITWKNQDKLKAAWTILSNDGLIESCWTQLDVPPAAQSAFIDSMKKKYGMSFDIDPILAAYINNSFKLSTIFPAHAMRFAAETNLDRLLSETISQPNEILSQRLLKIKEQLQAGGELGACLITELDCLNQAVIDTELGKGGGKVKLNIIMDAICKIPLEGNCEDTLYHVLLDPESGLSNALAPSEECSADKACIDAINHALDDYRPSNRFAS